MNDKQLLLKDLCARLLYGVIGEYSWKGREPYNRELTGTLYDELKSSWNSSEDSQFLPYLRPMSSMTEDENKKLDEIWIKHTIEEGADYLNSIHVDYRGLIEKGLAIEVTKENNPYKE